MRENISCPIELTTSVICNKWKPLIVRDLLHGTKRFSELMRSVPKISQKVLTDNLRSLENDGILTREVFAEVPTRVEYTLTGIGQSLAPLIEIMQQWGMEYKQTIRS